MFVLSEGGTRALAAAVKRCPAEYIMPHLKSFFKTNLASVLIDVRQPSEVLINEEPQTTKFCFAKGKETGNQRVPGIKGSQCGWRTLYFP